MLPVHGLQAAKGTCLESEHSKAMSLDSVFGSEEETCTSKRCTERLRSAGVLNPSASWEMLILFLMKMSQQAEVSSS